MSFNHNVTPLSSLLLMLLNKRTVTESSSQAIISSPGNQIRLPVYYFIISGAATRGQHSGDSVINVPIIGEEKVLRY